MTWTIVVKKKAHSEGGWRSLLGGVASGEETRSLCLFPNGLSHYFYNQLTPSVGTCKRLLQVFWGPWYGHILLNGAGQSSGISDHLPTTIIV